MDPAPRLIVVTGRPGAGKSTLAGRLGAALGLPVLHRDRVKAEMARAGTIPDNATATQAFFDRMQATLARGGSLVADAAFQHPVWETRLASMSQWARIGIVVCTVPLEIARARRLARVADDPGWRALHPDPALEVALRTGDWPLDEPYAAPRLAYPTTVVDTTDPPDVVVRDVLGWLGALPWEPLRLRDRQEGAKPAG